MTNDKLSTQMAEALALANAERAELNLVEVAVETAPGDGTTTFVQEETTEDRTPVQV